MNPAATVLLLICLLHTARTHSNGLDSGICDNFYVAHGSSSDNDSHQVTLEILENGEPIECFMPQTEYQSEYYI